MQHMALQTAYRAAVRISTIQWYWWIDGMHPHAGRIKTNVPPLPQLAQRKERRLIPPIGVLSTQWCIVYSTVLDINSNVTTTYDTFRTVPDVNAIGKHHTNGDPAASTVASHDFKCDWIYCTQIASTLHTTRAEHQYHIVHAKRTASMRTAAVAWSACVPHAIAFRWERVRRHSIACFYRIHWIASADYEASKWNGKLCSSRSHRK